MDKFRSEYLDRANQVTHISFSGQHWMIIVVFMMANIFHNSPLFSKNDDCIKTNSKGIKSQKLLLRFKLNWYSNEYCI